MDKEFFGDSEFGKRKVYDFESNPFLKFIISLEDIQSFLQEFYEKVLLLHREEIESDELWHVIFWQKVMIGAGFPPSKWPEWFVNKVCGNAFQEWKPLPGQYGSEKGKAKRKALDYGTLLLCEIVRHPKFGRQYKPDVKLKGEGNGAQVIVANILGMTIDGVNKICQRARGDFGGSPSILDIIHLSAYPIGAVFENSKK